ncbi:hypothetical protein D3C87_2013510 [compost metagenome]
MKSMCWPISAVMPGPSPPKVTSRTSSWSTALIIACTVLGRAPAPAPPMRRLPGLALAAAIRSAMLFHGLSACTAITATFWPIRLIG